MTIAVDAAGWRPPLVSRLFATLIAASISMYWLYPYVWFWVVAALFWLRMVARAVASPFTRTTLVADKTLLAVHARSWLGANSVQLRVTSDTKVNVQRDVERMTTDFFPEHYLLVQGETEELKTLAGHDPIVLDQVRLAVLAAIKRPHP